MVGDLRDRVRELSVRELGLWYERREGGKASEPRTSTTSLNLSGWSISAILRRWTKFCLACVTTCTMPHPAVGDMGVSKGSDKGIAPSPNPAPR